MDYKDCVHFKESGMFCTHACTHTECLKHTPFSETKAKAVHINDIKQVADKLLDKPVIKDSGERTNFDTGAVRDMHAGKGRMDLLPMSALIELAKHCEAGALKYVERNVDKGIPQHSFIDSAMRHLAKYTRGDKDEPHLVAALWNIAWAVNQEVEKPEMIDLPNR